MRLIVFAALHLSLLVLTGCWDHVEIQNRLYLFSLGVDYVSPGPNPYLITAEIPVVHELSGTGSAGGAPKGGGAGRPSWLIRVRAKTMSEAMDLIATRSFRQPFVGHLKAIVVGERAARRGILDLMDYFERAPAAPRRVKLVVCRGRASDFFGKVSPRIDKMVGIALHHQITDPKYTMRIANLDIGRFEDMTWAYSGSAILAPVAMALPDSVQMDGGALLRMGRLKTFISEEQVQGYNYVRSRAKGGSIQIGRAGFHLESAKAKVRCTTRGGSPSFTIRVDLVAIIDEKHQDATGSFSPSVEESEKELQRYVGACIEGALKVTRQTGLDYLDLGQYLSRHCPDEWDSLAGRWSEAVKSVPVRVVVKAEVMQEGLVE